MNEKSINERLKHVRELWEVSQREMARRLKMSNQNYANIERGIQPISAKAMIELDSRDINLHWLITGEGGEFRSSELLLKECQLRDELEAEYKNAKEPERVYEAIKDSRAAVIEENEIREEAEETVKRWRKPTKEEIEEAAEEALKRRSESAWRKQRVPRIDLRGCTCRRGKRIGRILRIAELIDTIMGGVDDCEV